MSLPFTILLVDDDRSVARSLDLHLKPQGYDTILAFSYGEAVKALDENPIDLVISDLRIGDKSGIDVIRHAKREQEGCEAIVITAFGDMESAVEALKLGARDYLLKPLNIDELLIKIRAIFENKKLSRTVELLRREIDVTAAEIYLGRGKNMAQLHRMMDQVADTDATVLLEGESGTGKSIYARHMHAKSRRRDNPFIIVNCAALPDNIIESELFGHRKGSFTGAIENKRGLFEQAGDGSILLDEISEMPLSSQPKLLHVMEERRVRRVGDEREIPLKCRILIATNRDLLEAIRKGRFREDLYYRIAVFRIVFPPLRERPEDIMPLAYHFLERHKSTLRHGVKTISKEAEKIIRSYHYPGNIRELDNIIQRAVILCDGDTLTPEILPIHITEAPVNLAPQADQTASLEAMEIEHIKRVLAHCRGNVVRASAVLGIARSSLWRKMKRYDLK
jgi:DNA-binding NtrC family response regulator